MYNPFGKPLSQLVASDLAALQDAAEGWYVEYKERAKDAGAVAKSLSSFANTYGGRLIYGIFGKTESSRQGEDSVISGAAGCYPTRLTLNPRIRNCRA